MKIVRSRPLRGKQSLQYKWNRVQVEKTFFSWATANGFITMKDLVHKKYQFVLLQVSLVAGKRQETAMVSPVDIQFLNNALL